MFLSNPIRFLISDLKAPAVQRMPVFALSKSTNRLGEPNTAIERTKQSKLELKWNLWSLHDQLPVFIIRPMIPRQKSHKASSADGVNGV